MEVGNIIKAATLNPLMHNVPEWSDTSFAARFVKCV